MTYTEIDLTGQLAEDILDSDDYEQVEFDIVDQRRWVNLVREVFKRQSDNTYWSLLYEQDKNEDGYSASEVGRLEQVYPKEVVTTVYVTKDKL